MEKQKKPCSLHKKIIPNMFRFVRPAVSRLNVYSRSRESDSNMQLCCTTPYYTNRWCNFSGCYRTLWVLECCPYSLSRPISHLYKPLFLSRFILTVSPAQITHQLKERKREREERRDAEKLEERGGIEERKKEEREKDNFFFFSSFFISLEYSYSCCCRAVQRGKVCHFILFPTFEQ